MICKRGDIVNGFSAIRPISAPYPLFVVGTILSFHFRRGRVFLILVLISLCHCLYTYCLVGANGPETPE